MKSWKHFLFTKHTHTYKYKLALLITSMTYCYHINKSYPFMNFDLTKEAIFSSQMSKYLKFIITYFRKRIVTTHIITQLCEYIMFSKEQYRDKKSHCNPIIQENKSKQIKGFFRNHQRNPIGIRSFFCSFHSVQ